MKKIVKLELCNITPFKNHPFKVKQDDSFIELKDSIRINGLLEPLLVRPDKIGGYELISGHRRKLALELCGIKEADCYIEDLSDDEATIKMVDSNIYRNLILPSEKAFAYKMKLDAMKHQGKKTFGTECHKSRDKIAESSSDSSRQIHNYIRLTNLIPELLQLVDDTVLKDKRTVLTMGLKPAVELSYLNKDEQKLVYMGITYEDLTPSHGQAIKIRQLAKNKELTFDSLEDILCEQKGNQHEQISFNKSNIEKALPSELLKRDKRYIEQYIIKAIENYRKQELERGDVYDLDM